jgi:hypothetical protein
MDLLELFEGLALLLEGNEGADANGFLNHLKRRDISSGVLQGVYRCGFFQTSNNNITRNNTNHFKIVFILRVSIFRDCVGCIYQALIKSFNLFLIK